MALALSTFGCNVLTGSADLAIACEDECELSAPRRSTSSSSTEPLDGGRARPAPDGAAPALDAGDERGTDAGRDDVDEQDGGAPERVRCGDVGCGGEEAECCVRSGAMTCIGAQASCSYGVRMRCDEAAGCGAGQVCCLDGVYRRNEAVCTARSDCWGSGAMVLCSTSGDCLSGQTCLPFVQPPGYARCVTAW